MNSGRRSGAIVWALYANAAILAAILIALLARTPWLSATPAMGEPTGSLESGGPSAGPITVVPCQLSPSTFGCFLVDAVNQTLCVYEYRQDEQAQNNRTLALTASRYFRYDLGLKNYNTSPAWFDVQKMLDDENRRQERTPSPATQPAEGDVAK